MKSIDYEDEDSFKDANRKNEDEDSFKDANRKNEDEDNFKDANRKKEEQVNFNENESNLVNGKYIYTKTIKTTIFSNRTKRYLIPPLMYPMAAFLQQEIASHAQELKDKYLRTNNFLQRTVHRRK